MPTDKPLCEKPETISSAEEAARSAAEKIASEVMKLRGAPEGGAPASEPESTESTPAVSEHHERSETVTVDDPALVNQRKSEIEKKYGVFFDTPETLPADQRERLRQPTLSELQVLDRALEKSPGSTATSMTTGPLRIAFFKPGASDPCAHHVDIKGGSRIVVFGDGTNFNLTNDDTKSGKTSLGSVLLHELGHRTEKVVRPDLEPLGWKKLSNGQFGLEAQDGSLYQYVKPAEQQGCGEPYWTKVNSDGTVALNSDGSDTRIDDRQMKSVVKTPQPMGLAPHPSEVFANSARMYRQNAETRAELKATSPEIYAYMEHVDKKELEMKGGTDYMNRPNLVRAADGSVQKNDSAIGVLPPLDLILETPTSRSAA